MTDATASRRRAVVLVAHGTHSDAGRQVVLDLVEDVARALPDAVITDAYVDVQEPRVADAVAALAPDHDEVIAVPLLFCGGYHVQVDVSRAVEPFDNARSTGSLGPASLIAELMVERLSEAGARPGDAVVMAAAGSSRPEANADARAQARLLAQAWGGPVDVGFGSAGTPRVHEAVMINREDPRVRVVVVPLLLGEGHFNSRLRGSGADLVAQPLGAAPQVVARILEKVEEPQSPPSQAPSSDGVVR